MNKKNPILSLKHSDKVAVISHINPDGDSLGSLMALGISLKKICGNVDIFVNDVIPERYKFLPEIETVVLYDENSDTRYDYCFVLDCGDEDRLGYSKKLLRQSKTVINIDHHVSNTMFGHMNIIDNKASSTCEVVYKLIKDCFFIDDLDISTCLYTGIATDTGSFVYDNTSAKTHKIASKLLKTGVDIQQISYHLYQSKSLKSVKFLGHVLNKLETSYDGKVVIIPIPLTLLEEYEVSEDEVEGVINYARDIKGVEVAVLLKELGRNKVKLGFRSKNDVDVSKLALEFGGGGHKKASGATVFNTLEEAKRNLEEKLSTYVGW